MTIAVDGPASSGKGTVARGVARALGYQYIDTGAMYRTVALFARRQGVDWDNEDALAAVARELRFGFTFSGDLLRVYANDTEVTKEIRQNVISRGASAVSRHRAVRTALLDLQRQLGAAGAVVMDGRDIGTVILPDAQLKVYLDAAPEERARRRHRELTVRGEDVPLADVLRLLLERDKQDMEREVAPLKQADDAVYLDTTHQTIPEAIEAVLVLALERGAVLAG
ncbi:MAG: (d)CMP kinase [Proteobacteria bacterium]|nr:(d)CMP kinase [Pseudomonadota bacterium]